jgi:riboflavin kinase / FMN adenylyltransferase
MHRLTFPVDRLNFFLPVLAHASHPPALVNIIRLANELQADPRPVCAAIGVFDGLHLGHQAVLRQTLKDAAASGGMAVAITFDRHPNAVVAPERNPLLIQSLTQRLRGLERLGFDVTWLIPFDADFSRIPAEQFVRDLVRDFGNVRSLSVGANFTFGYRRCGDLALLKQLGEHLGFAVHGLGAIEVNGQPVSSTRIRESIQRGDLDTASALLGRSYSVAGLILRGDQRGRQIGVPTANVDTTGLVLPPTGVYAGWATAGNTRRPAVLNIGLRPTIQAPTPRLQCEVHLLDFSGDLYGLELEVILQQRLRDEQRFPSLELLQSQIQTDIATARRVLDLE